MRRVILTLAYLVGAGHGQQPGESQMPAKAEDAALLLQPFAKIAFSNLSPLEPLAALLLTPQSTHAFNPSSALAAKWPQDVPRSFMHGAARAHRVMLPEHSVPAMSMSDNETEPVKESASASHLVALSTNAGAAICATFEVAEDIECIGHGHGMLLLTLSKLCREANVLREAFVEQAEDIKEGAGKMSWKVSSAIKKPFRFLLRKLSSKVATVVLALGALAAACMEVLEDSVLGGHHGTLLLAINELLELLESSNIAKGGFLRVIKQQWLRLTILLGATACALVEMFGVFATSSAKLGAHHGVLILAVSRLLRCVGLMRKEAGEKED